MNILDSGVTRQSAEVKFKGTFFSKPVSDL